jgi:hypothetical protein
MKGHNQKICHIDVKPHHTFSMSAAAFHRVTDRADSHKAIAVLREGV